jgi:hypothetical protein
LSFLHLRRAGTYLRVADPDWDNPLEGSYAGARGGRWNAPGSFPVVYLNRDVETARANVRRRFQGQPYQIEDVRPDRLPLLISTELDSNDYVDVVSGAGCAAAGLPRSYPFDAAGELVPHDVCQPIGQAAWDDGDPGIACRSAAPGASRSGEELAWFHRDSTSLIVAASTAFKDWYWTSSSAA